MKGELKMNLNLIEIALKAQENMRKEKEYIDGVKYTMQCFKESKVYNGSYLDCVQYLNGKITIASLNAINNPAYIGCIALYSAMIDELLYLVKQEGK
jgi:hypothetical protein